MAHVLGTGPVAVTTSTGSHVIIPLSAVTYDTATGKIAINGWTAPTGTSTQAAADWATYLLGEGDLTVDTSSAPTQGSAGGPAFLAEAVHPGDEVHNNITLKIIGAPAPANPPSATVYALEVTVENTYPGLTLATLAEVIGIAVDGGTKPGLVHLVTPPAPPPTLMPTDQSVDFVAVTPAPARATLVGAGPADAFVLEAPGDGGGFTSFKAMVTNDALRPGTFELKTTWKKSNSGTTTSHAAAFAYVLNISKPAGGDYGAPPPGTNSYSLTGGEDPGNTPIPAKPPKATIPSV